MTSHHRDPATPAALHRLRDWLPTEALLTRLQRRLRAQGTSYDDIDQRIITELGVTTAEWHGYHAVRRAADRYQHRPTAIPPPRSAHELT